MIVTHPFRLSLLLFGAAAAIAIGCDKPQSAVRTYSAPKDPPAPQVVSAPQLASDVPESDGAAPVTWTLPAGWRQVPGAAQMRYATIQVSASEPKAELTVVPLPADAQAVLPNVQRWAGQLHLQQVADADLSKYVTETQVSGEQASIIDMTGSAQTGNPPTRLLAAIIPHDDRTWFFTLKAAEPIVAAQRSNFEQFIHSVQFPSAAAAPPQSSVAVGQSEGARVSTESQAATGQTYRLAKWKAPVGWQEQPGSNAMRVTSFRVGSGDQQAEVIVSKIQEDQTGSMLDNINRWRGQVGLEPVATANNAGFGRATIGNQPGLLINFAGPQKQLTVAVTVQGGDAWFVKLIGPPAVVAQQQDAFKQFLASMQFEPESH